MTEYRMITKNQLESIVFGEGHRLQFAFAQANKLYDSLPSINIDDLKDYLYEIRKYPQSTRDHGNTWFIEVNVEMIDKLLKQLEGV